jgi:tRNA (mo5U34)-methyltransferase
MLRFSEFYEILENNNLKKWLDVLPAKINRAVDPAFHGDLHKWYRILKNLPPIPTTSFAFNSDCIQIGSEIQDEKIKKRLRTLLKKLLPWRKGPFNVHGVYIDSEWISFLKWNRIASVLKPLSQRKILDIGCGNGYYILRMLGEKSTLVIGIEQLILYACQFNALKFFTGPLPAYILPVNADDIPSVDFFDTVFSMGVFYHRRSPIDHLLQLYSMLASGGELVIETLIVDGKMGEVIVPENRYAGMNNVWFIPSCLTLESWLKKTGFKNTRLIDVSKTTGDEQRKTEWTYEKSLDDFLDKKNPEITIEGHPAPKRAVFLAEKN